MHAKTSGEIDNLPWLGVGVKNGEAEATGEDLQRVA